MSFRLIFWILCLITFFALATEGEQRSQSIPCSTDYDCEVRFGE